MAGPPIPLTTIQGGLNRLRTKGAALRNSLYDLVNGYVTLQKTVVIRPGSFRTAQLTSDSKGLFSFQGVKHVFSHKVITVPTGYVLHILAHPAGTDPDNPIPIKTIHFVQAFMGFPYVVAEFDLAGVNTTLSPVYHYWCQSGAIWQPNTDYKIGDIVSPSVANGLVFQATRISAANPVWTANTVHAVNDVIEPTTPNGFYFTAVEVDGDNPVSGAVEPLWPTATGAQVFEDSEVDNNDTQATTAPQASTNAPATTTQDRYNNPYRGSGQQP